jgi:hypothetical protein
MMPAAPAGPQQRQAIAQPSTSVTTSSAGAASALVNHCGVSNRASSKRPSYASSRKRPIYRRPNTVTLTAQGDGPAGGGVRFYRVPGDSAAGRCLVAAWDGGSGVVAASV